MNSSTEQPPQQRLRSKLLEHWDQALAESDDFFAAAYPGPPGPGPVHTVYLPVTTFDTATSGRWRAEALAAIDEHQQQWQQLLGSLTANLGAESVHTDSRRLHELTVAKIEAQPIEDLRIDFEDGFRAHRGSAADDDDEDTHATRAGAVVAAIGAAGAGLPGSWGLRIRSLAPPTRRRGLRTLDLFLTAVLAHTDQLPLGFVITLPKVTSVQQVQVFGDVLTELEAVHQLIPGTLRFEIQVETPQTVLGANGRVPLSQMIRAAGGRISGLHFGTYDYTASMGILGRHQNLRHPVADFAKQLMLLAAAETGVRVSDGSDNRLPIGDGVTVGRRWADHAEGVQRALTAGIYQGWDLHPAQLPTRFAATFAFFRTGLTDAAVRLADYHRRRSTGVLDEPATAFALARQLAAALECGAVADQELLDVAGIDAAVVDRYLVRGATPTSADPKGA